ncbi:F-box protein At4g18380-like [Henckelia pumila]|uniref:F-box protein At4g18380-like n=1 Tax=Henckelia pumila TaxID=405737 RepID=UPI003C6DFEEF
MASEDENPFNRLPKELIISIFDKISDAKFLCKCSLVSKNFAALVLQTRVLFVEMPCFFKGCICHPDPAAARPSRLLISFLRDIPNFLFKPLMAMWSLLKSRFRRGDETALSKPDIVSSLKKFSCVDSITFHFPLHDASNSQPSFEPLLRWKYGSSGFIFVSAKNRVASIDENTGDSRVQTANDVTRKEVLVSLLSMFQHLVDCAVRLAFMYTIFDNRPNIKHFVAVDNMKQGRVIFDDQEISVMKEKSVLRDKFCLKLWKAPLVKVPLAGCIMEEVSLILIRRIEGCDALEAENSFAEEEYRELSMILVKEEACFQKITSLSKLLII